MSNLRVILQSLAADFSDSVLVAIRGSSLEDILGGATSGGRPPRASTADGEAAPPKRRKGRLARRSEKDIAAMADQIVAHLRAHGPMRAEKIRADLQIDRRELARPIQLALDSKGLKKSGQKRATEYTVGGLKTAAKAPKAPKRAKTKPAKKFKATLKAKTKTKTKAKAKAKPAKKKTAPRRTKKRALAALDKHVEKSKANHVTGAAEAAAAG